MVYCAKCGTLNADTATNCTNCGAPLYSAESRPYSRYERRRYYEEGYGYRRRGSGFGLIFAGAIVILIGLSLYLGYSFAQFWTIFWPVFLVLIGIWIVTMGLRRNRRYSRQPPPPQ